MSLVISSELCEKLFYTNHQCKVKSSGTVYEASISLIFPNDVVNFSTLARYILPPYTSLTIVLQCESPLYGNGFHIKDGAIHYTPKGETNGETAIIKPSTLIKHLIKQGCLLLIKQDVSEQVGKKLKNRFFELVTSDIGSVASDFGRIKISEDVNKIFNTPTSSLGGTLLNSCMRHESKYDCSSHASFYNDVGAKVVYIKDVHDNLEARALLWENCIDESGNRFTFIDRIYANYENEVAIKKYASDRGWGVKVHQDSSSPEIMFSDGKILENYKFEIHSKIKPKGYPYIDTLCYLDVMSTALCSCPSFGSTRIQDTTGLVIYCCNCGRVVERINLYVIDHHYYCPDCVVWSDISGEYIPIDESVYSDYHSSYIRMSESAVHHKYGRVYIYDHSFVMIGDKCYHTIEDVVVCDKCMELTVNDDVWCDENGTFYCHKCKEKLIKTLKTLKEEHLI